MKNLRSLLFNLNKNKNIIALQDASISLVPMILTITALLMVAEFSAFINAPDYWVSSIRNIHTYFYIFFPLIFTVSLSVAFAKSKNVDATCLVLICFCLLFISIADGFDTFLELKESIYFKLLPIPLCYFTSSILKYFASKPSFYLFKSDEMSLHLNKSFNYILPSLITFILMFLLVFLVETAWHYIFVIDSTNQIHLNSTDNFLYLFSVKIIFKLTWFFGVNPNHIFSFLFSPYIEPFLENQAAFEAAKVIPHINVRSMYYFTDMGGAGAVLCLILAILLHSKSKRHKRIAKLSILPSTFNISEIIHYGLPIVFNPFLFVPFIFVPIILHINTYIFMSLGLVTPVVVSIPWTTPPLINAYLATGGDFMAVLLQLINLFIGAAIYLKFLRLLEASHLDDNVIANFSKKFNLESRNIQALQYRNQQSLMRNLQVENEINSFLLQVSKGDLILYYQPILCVKTRKIVKVEALIRLRDEHGKIFPPTFINVLSEVGLSIEIDKWVVRRAVKQSHNWPDSFGNLHISVNISPNSLTDRTFVDFLIDMHHKSVHPLSIEILENQAVFEEDIINQHLKLLKEHDIPVYLDDFGSGFSALSMLSKLHINGVKYDIDFSYKLHSNEGSKLFDSCLNLSKTLKHITVLEGVETKEQFDLAVKSDVDFIQGFYISVPLKHDELSEFLNSEIPHVLDNMSSKKINL